MGNVNHRPPRPDHLSLKGCKKKREKKNQTVLELSASRNKVSPQENVRKESRSGRDSSSDLVQSSARGARGGTFRGEIRDQAKQLAWPGGKENTHKTHNLNTIKLNANRSSVGFCRVVGGRCIAALILLASGIQLIHPAKLPPPAFSVSASDGSDRFRLGPVGFP